jgi:hypothetical protein
VNAPNLPPVNVPTLTEVVDWSPAVIPQESDPAAGGDPPFPDLSDEVPAQELHQPTGMEPAFASACLPAVDEVALTQRILSRIQQEVDRMLEERLPPAMAAVLDRAVEELVAHARNELAVTLRDVVAQAVLDEIASTRRSAGSTSA